MSSKPRNPFSVYLLRQLIEWEAAQVFGAGRKNLIKYLAVPKRSKQNSTYAIRQAGRNLTQTQLDLAASTVSWVIQRDKKFTHSDEKLNEVVQRITFFGTFSSWDDFEKHYAKWVDIYRPFTGKPYKKITAKLVKIHESAERLRREETIFVRQSGKLNGHQIPTIVRLTGGHVIRPLFENNNVENDDVYKDIDEDKPDYGDDFYHPGLKCNLLSDYIAITFHNIEDTRNIGYEMIDAHLRRVGLLTFWPIEIIRSQRLKKEIRVDILNCSFEYASTIWIHEINAIDWKVFKSIVYRLADIICGLAYYLNLSHSDVLDNLEIRLCADREAFNPHARILNFSDAMPEIPPFSPRKLEKRDSRFYETFIGGTFRYFPSSRFYSIDFVELYWRSMDELSGYGLY